MTAVTSESNILGSVITPDMITSASEQIGGGIEQVVASGIVDSSGAGFDLSSMMADLTQPLEVCYSTLDATQWREKYLHSYKYHSNNSYKLC